VLMLHLLAEPGSPRSPTWDLDLGATPEKRNFLGCGGGKDERDSVQLSDSVQLIRWLANPSFL